MWPFVILPCYSFWLCQQIARCDSVTDVLSSAAVPLSLRSLCLPHHRSHRGVVMFLCPPHPLSPSWCAAQYSFCLHPIRAAVCGFSVLIERSYADDAFGQRLVQFSSGHILDTYLNSFSKKGEIGEDVQIPPNASSGTAA